VQHLVASSAILTAGATVLETAGANNIDVPITTSHGAAALVTEGAGIAESDAAFSKRTLGGYKYGQLIQISRELLDDELFDIIPYVAEAGGRNVGLALGSDLLVGNGSSKPSGILQTSTLGATGGTGVVGVPTADNLIDLMFSVIAPYRASSACAWLVKDSTLGPIRKLKDTAGRYLFDPGFNGAATVGAVDSLLGKPIYTDPYVPATGLGLKSVIFGDISRYFARIAGGIRFERSDEYAFNADLVTFKVVIRGDGVLVDQTGGVKHFIGGAS
jgi:HK97 family phage major capsid protein